MTYDAIVIGAGPAGACAALALARQGRAVAIVEKARIPAPQGVRRIHLGDQPRPARQVRHRRCLARRGRTGNPARRAFRRRTVRDGADAAGRKRRLRPGAGPRHAGPTAAAMRRDQPARKSSSRAARRTSPPTETAASSGSQRETAKWKLSRAGRHRRARLVGAGQACRASLPKSNQPVRPSRLQGAFPGCRRCPPI